MDVGILVSNIDVTRECNKKEEIQKLIDRIDESAKNTSEQMVGVPPRRGCHEYI